MPGLAARGLTLTGAAAGVIPNITNFTGPGISLDTEDVTAHDSTGGWEEVVPTILRSGEVTFDINYTPAAHHYAAHGLAFNLVTRLIDTWTVGGPMGAWVFTGYVSKFEPSAPHDGKLSASVAIKITGAVTIP
jgi:predicted secreted protein